MSIAVENARAGGLSLSQDAFLAEAADIDSEIERVTSELRGLPLPTGSAGGDRIGWRGRAGMSEGAGPVSVDIDLGEEIPIDGVALVPVYGEPRRLPAGIVFPRRFTVELSNDSGFKGARLMVDRSKEGVRDPGAYPVHFEWRSIVARHIRVKMWRGDADVCGLSEVLALSGNRAVSVGSKATASEDDAELPIWGAENLVDGMSHLGPPVGDKDSRSNGYRSAGEMGPGAEGKWVQVFLQEAMPIDEVRLFPAEPADSADAAGARFPLRFLVECAPNPEFANPVVLADYTGRDFPAPGANPVIIPGRHATCAWVRVTTTLLRGTKPAAMELAEIQVYSGGRNVVRGHYVGASDGYRSKREPFWNEWALTDGFTSQREIVAYPVWLRGLTQRRALEERIRKLREEKAMLAQARASGIAVTATIWTAAALVSAIFVAGYYSWRMRGWSDAGRRK